MTKEQVFTGSCHCRAVAYEVTGPLREVIGCHCTQCRKTTGHMMAATAAPQAAFRLVKDDGLKWYRASEDARRGFCANCGATMFWVPDAKDYIAIAAGTLDGKTGLKIAGHIFCEDKGDYYEITDGEFQFPQGRAAGPD